MKLRTEMVDFHGRMLPRTGSHVLHFSLEHDAACAHALMQAMEEFDGAEYQRDYILCRASEIMAGWGFDSGEAEE